MEQRRASGPHSHPEFTAATTPVTGVSSHADWLSRRAEELGSNS